MFIYCGLRATVSGTTCTFSGQLIEVTLVIIFMAGFLKFFEVFEVFEVFTH